MFSLLAVAGLSEKKKKKRSTFCMTVHVHGCIVGDLVSDWGFSSWCHLQLYEGSFHPVKSSNVRDWQQVRSLCKDRCARIEETK